MNTYVSGPLGWALLTEAAKLADQDPSQYLADFITLLKSFAVIFPCKFCRQSLTMILDSCHPMDDLDPRDQPGCCSTLIYWLHGLVNRKLGRDKVNDDLTWDRYTRRLAVWAHFACASTVSDWLGILALSLPLRDEGFSSAAVIQHVEVLARLMTAANLDGAERLKAAVARLHLTEKDLPLQVLQVAHLMSTTPTTCAFVTRLLPAIVHPDDYPIKRFCGLES